MYPACWITKAVNTHSEYVIKVPTTTSVTFVSVMRKLWSIKQNVRLGT